MILHNVQPPLSFYIVEPVDGVAVVGDPHAACITRAPASFPIID